VHINTKCKCERECFHNVRVRVIQDRDTLEIDDANVMDSVEAEQLTQNALRELHGYV
jgi:hypothetical protein